jgi:hypothetical protein
MHGDDGHIDRIGSLDGWSGSGVGEQASMEKDHNETVSKIRKGEDMGVTHEQVNLMLHLYELRREAKLREAREWLSINFHVKTLDDVMRLCPPGSKENAYVRMVIGYWEMVAGIVNRGLVDEDLFFETSGEQWGLWEQVKPIIAAWREMFASPQLFSNLEENCRRMEAWREKRNPGSNEAIRKMHAQMSQAVQASKAQAASN